MELLPSVWFALIVLLLCGYSILDGFDLGVGVLNPFLAKTPAEKAQLFSGVGPFWDGNEVWLLAGGGALFAAFPTVYATVFSGFYLALMLVLFALVLRAVSLEFWHYDETRRALWSATFTVGSLIPALLFGVAMGNILMGVPLDGNGDFAGSFFTLLRPFPLSLGLYGLSAFVLHGAVYAAMKSDGPVRERSIRFIKSLSAAAIFLLAMTLVLGYRALPHACAVYPAWTTMLATAGLLALVSILTQKGRRGAAFLASALAMATLWLTAALIQYPVLLRSADGNRHLTVHNSASSPLSLKVMLVIALIGMPFVLGYTVYVYRVFARKLVK